MELIPRRRFLGFASAAAGATVAHQLVPLVSTSTKALRLGLLVDVTDHPGKVIARVHSFGLPSAHVIMREFSDEMAPRLRAALHHYEVEATVFLVETGRRKVRSSRRAAYFRTCPVALSKAADRPSEAGLRLREIGEYPGGI